MPIVLNISCKPTSSAYGERGWVAFLPPRSLRNGRWDKRRRHRASDNDNEGGRRIGFHSLSKILIENVNKIDNILCISQNDENEKYK